ncbi:MAG: T9SS type A sorting domain-containing protein [Saprospiraceae bacterium]|nr:T9SS type A sorting domain-containing protein [Saprospiraceae bacterium]MBK7738973.1 T9SS type A sorting domain-containing protein [Saprospiraceae bacterium]MBK7913557.1 T9SS type A sorting domain-containing protein [Saprospiraceae bacterium]
MRTLINRSLGVIPIYILCIPLAMLCFCNTGFSQQACDILQCNDAAKIKIEIGKSYPISAADLLDIGYCTDHSYKLDYLYKGILNPLDTITSNTPSFFQYRIVDQTNGNSCWGHITLIKLDCIDDFIPVKSNKSYNLFCYESFKVDDLGFNIPDSVELIKTGDNQFTASNWARCGAVKIKVVRDFTIHGTCDSSFMQIIYRTWRVTSPDNRSFDFTDTITVSYWNIDSSYKLPDYNGIDQPVFDCRNSWLRGRNGNPDGTLSFEKNYKACNTLGTTYTDDTLSIQPEGCHRILELRRNWFILNWCNFETFNLSQLVYVRCYNDSINPVALCKSGIIEFQLNQNNVLTLNANELLQDATDNCGLAQTSWDEAGFIQSKQFGLADTGKILDLKVWVYDSSGNKTSCDVQVKILPNQIVRIDPMLQTENLKLFCIPNPMQTSSTIFFESDKFRNGNINIRNQNGELVFKMPIISNLSNKWVYYLKDSDLPISGVYYLTYQNEGIFKTVKLVRF